jgi:hypothetical protein
MSLPLMARHTVEPAMKNIQLFICSYMAPPLGQGKNDFGFYGSDANIYTASALWAAP